MRVESQNSFVRRFPDHFLMDRLNSRDSMIITSAGGIIDELLDKFD
jgi:transcriptional regulator GlxA family with amidase domain